MTDQNPDIPDNTTPSDPSRNQNADHSSSDHKMTPRRLIAIAAIVLLGAMYILTLLAAIFDPSASGRVFRFCIGLTILVPVFAWFLIYFTDHFQH